MIATSGFLTAVVHKIRFRPGLPRTPLGELNSALRDPLAGLRGPTSEGRGGKGTRREGRDRERRKWKGRGRDVTARKREGRGREEEGEDGREVRKPPPSIPAYAPDASDFHPLLCTVLFNVYRNGRGTFRRLPGLNLPLKTTQCRWQRYGLT